MAIWWCPFLLGAVSFGMLGSRSLLRFGVLGAVAGIAVIAAVID
jgi:hypothetical protein